MISLFSCCSASLFSPHGYVVILVCQNIPQRLFIKYSLQQDYTNSVCVCLCVFMCVCVCVCVCDEERQSYWLTTSELVLSSIFNGPHHCSNDQGRISSMGGPGVRMRPGDASDLTNWPKLSWLVFYVNCTRTPPLTPPPPLKKRKKACSSMLIMDRLNICSYYYFSCTPMNMFSCNSFNCS